VATEPGEKFRKRKNCLFSKGYLQNIAKIHTRTRLYQRVENRDDHFGPAGPGGPRVEADRAGPEKLCERAGPGGPTYARSGRPMSN
jgi:hypothetical protein